MSTIFSKPHQSSPRESPNFSNRHALAPMASSPAAMPLPRRELVRPALEGASRLLHVACFNVQHNMPLQAFAGCPFGFGSRAARRHRESLRCGRRRWRSWSVVPRSTWSRRRARWASLVEIWGPESITPYFHDIIAGHLGQVDGN